jgi:hypothetical protein
MLPGLKAGGVVRAHIEASRLWLWLDRPDADVRL